MKKLNSVVLIIVAFFLGGIFVQVLRVNAQADKVANENGDTNGDGRRDISDAVYLLEWLFLGGDQPKPCIAGEPPEVLQYFSLVDLPDGQGGTVKTIRITGANLQLVNGLGATGLTDGTGNLTIGYNEGRLPGNDRRTGSHNLILGSNNNFNSYGGIVAGAFNSITAPYSSVNGGVSNTAAGMFSAVGGGDSNAADGHASTVSGGGNNSAIEEGSSVGGGRYNSANGRFCSVSGGQANRATGVFSSISGGDGNQAIGDLSSVTGGQQNIATGQFSVISGGFQNTAQGDRSTVSAGFQNTAGGGISSVSGGQGNNASGGRSSVVGGYLNNASGIMATVIGGTNCTEPQDQGTAVSVLKITGG